MAQVGTSQKCTNNHYAQAKASLIFLIKIKLVGIKYSGTMYTPMCKDVCKDVTLQQYTVPPLSRTPKHNNKLFDA